MYHRDNLLLFESLSTQVTHHLIPIHVGMILLVQLHGELGPRRIGLEALIMAWIRSHVLAVHPFTLLVALPLRKVDHLLVSTCVV